MVLALAQSTISFLNNPHSIPHQSWLSEKKPHAKPIRLDQSNNTLPDVLLPDGMNINQELVKQGWCWLYRRDAPGDVVLEGLKKEAREARKELWADS
jgi:endonuclease YncB( thermonuclease family)